MIVSLGIILFCILNAEGYREIAKKKQLTLHQSQLASRGDQEV